METVCSHGGRSVSVWLSPGSLPHGGEASSSWRWGWRCRGHLSALASAPRPSNQGRMPVQPETRISAQRQCLLHHLRVVGHDAVCPGVQSDPRHVGRVCSPHNHLLCGGVEEVQDLRGSHTIVQRRHLRLWGTEGDVPSRAPHLEQALAAGGWRGAPRCGRQTWGPRDDGVGRHWDVPVPGVPGPSPIDGKPWPQADLQRSGLTSAVSFMTTYPAL